jgi:hypothetical protein
VIDLDTLRLALEVFSSGLRVSLPGRVTRVDAARGRVSVRPELRAPRPGPDDLVEYDELPELLDVPVLLTGTAAVEVSVALEAGDPGLVVFADFPLGEWLRSGSLAAAPLDAHGTSGAVFVPGLFPSGEGPALPAEGARIGMRGGTSMTISNAEIRLGGPSASAAGLHSDMQALANVFANWIVSPQDGGLALKTALETLALTGWPHGAQKVKVE